MGLFGTIGEAKFSEGGVYILPGVYRVEVLSVITKRTRAGWDGFIVEMKILESKNPERLPGSVCSWMVKLGQADSPGMGNVKQFLSAALNCDMSQITEQLAEAAVSPQNPLKGTILQASAVNITTKQNRPFTKVKWFHASVNAAEVAKDQAAA
jgi:hypothetical protein